MLRGASLLIGILGFVPIGAAVAQNRAVLPAEISIPAASAPPALTMAPVSPLIAAPSLGIPVLSLPAQAIDWGRLRLNDAQIQARLAAVGADAPTARSFEDFQARAPLFERDPETRVRRAIQRIGDVFREERAEATLPEPERQAIEFYAGFFYRAANRVLRGRAADEPEPAKRAAVALSELAASGLNRLPDHRGTVHRLYHTDDERVAGLYAPGRTATEYGFTSASISKRTLPVVGDGRFRLVFEIESETGKKIERISPKPGEREVIFRPGTNFLVVDRKSRIVRLSGREYEEHRIKLKEVPSRMDDFARSFLLDDAAWKDLKKTGSLPAEWIRVNDSLRSKVRTGWTKRGVPAAIGETVWEHSRKVRQAVLLYAANHPEIDARKAGLMALFHDVTEYRAPDFTPGDVGAVEKNRIEGEALDHLVRELGPEASGIKDLWREYEEGLTPEAVLVKQLDKFDPAVQALRYERMGYPVKDFYPYTRARLTDPALVRIFEALMRDKAAGVDPYRRYFELLERDGE